MLVSDMPQGHRKVEFVKTTGVESRRREEAPNLSALRDQYNAVVDKVATPASRTFAELQDQAAADNAGASDGDALDDDEDRDSEFELAVGISAIDDEERPGKTRGPRGAAGSSKGPCSSGSGCGPGAGAGAAAAASTSRR